MGKFFDRLFKKDVNDTGSNEEESFPSFVYGVQDTFELENSNDLIVVGRVNGKIRPEVAAYISNFGEEHAPISLTTVLGLEIDKSLVSEAEDCYVSLRIEEGKKLGIKTGSVIYSRDISMKDVHDAYISAIGDFYVGYRNLEISEEEYRKMSITDMAEAWRLYQWVQSMKEDKTEAEKEECHQKINCLAEALCKKILEANEIYTVVNKVTGEPHLLSQTIDNQDGTYTCTEPDILLITEPYTTIYQNMFPAEQFEIIKIENGVNRDGIRNFLGSTFYLNGACGVQILSEQTAIDASKLVQKPDDKDTPEINIPVTNPNLVRWLLLIAQLGKPETADTELIYKLYYRFMSIEMTKAKFIVPMRTDGEKPVTNETGTVVLEKDFTFGLATMAGKDDRDAIRMYTDWKRFRMVYDMQWDGFIQPISGMIDTFDCAINATEYIAAGCYIGKDMFYEMQQMANS